MTYKNKISCSPFLHEFVEIRKFESGRTWDLRLGTWDYHRTKQDALLQNIAMECPIGIIS